MIAAAALCSASLPEQKAVAATGAPCKHAARRALFHTHTHSAGIFPLVMPWIFCGNISFESFYSGIPQWASPRC